MRSLRPRPRHVLVAALGAGLAVSLATSGALASGGSPGPLADRSSGAAEQARHAYRAAGARADYVKLDLLAINDFHGNLQVVPSSSSSGRINSTPAGGVAYLARLLKDERARSRANGATPVTVAAGDLVGASPLISAAFHDEPTIEAMNELGLQVASVGNHEFDEGVTELKRLQNGGCLDDGPDGADGQNSCPGDREFAGADFTYLGANVLWQDPTGHSRPSVFPATRIMRVQGEKVAFIGMTLEGTGAIVSQAGIAGVTFADEVETANALVPGLRRAGVKSIVVLLHEGATPTDATAYNDCSGVSGQALEIAQNLSPAIDAVVSGHTHQAYNCVVPDPQGTPRLLTSAASFGRMVTKLHLLIDPRTHDVVRPAEYAANLIARNGDAVTPVPALVDLVDTYAALVQPIADQVIGHLDPGTQVSRTADANGGDSPLGNLVADAQLADPSVVGDGPAPVVALMNPGGIRADLVENEAGDVTYGAAFSVQPFNNFVVSMDLTGTQIEAVLNQQWNGGNESARKILQVAGLSYVWDASEAATVGGDALVGEVMIDDDGDPDTAMVPLVADQTYRVVVNSFLSDGGDNFSTFKDGTDKYVGGLDIDSLRAYLQAHDPYTATATDRISQQD